MESPFPDCSEWPYDEALKFSWINDDGTSEYRLFCSIDNWISWAQNGGYLETDDEGNDKYLFPEGWEEGQSGWILAGCADVASSHKSRRWWFWRIKALAFLDKKFDYKVIRKLEEHITRGTFSFTLNLGRNYYQRTGAKSGLITWDFDGYKIYPGDTDWYNVHPLAMLAHEMGHAMDDANRGLSSRRDSEIAAVKLENVIRSALFKNDPSKSNLYPRPGYRSGWGDLGRTAAGAWKNYDPREVKW